jgi:hypothetical protein
VPDILPRRRVLAASAAALPVLLATAGCRSAEVFAGPDPLAGRPTPSPDVITLQAVIAAEQAMITLYQAAVSSNPRVSVLEGLLAQHRQHLVRLRAQLVLPPGTSASASAGASASASAGAPASASASASAGAPAAAGPGRVTIARLRAAERASATDLVRQLVTVPPALAQLFASIAASDATHVVVLGG